jgi:hyperosmotically inducible protein
MMNPKTRITIGSLIAACGLALGGCDRPQKAPPPASGPDSTVSQRGSQPGAGTPDDSQMGGYSRPGVTNSGDAAASAGADSGRSAGDTMSDAWISTKVKTALITEKDLKASGIKVDAHDGEITLSGTAPSSTDVDRAASVARGIQGVKNVDNRIQVAQK